MAVNLIDSTDISVQQTGSDIQLNINNKNKLGNVVVDSIRTKNMFNIDSITTNNVISSTGVINYSAGFCYSEFIPVKPSTQYTISRTFSGTTGAEDLMRVAYYQSNKTFIDRPTSADRPWTITTPNNCYYIRLSYQYEANNNATNTNIQVEEGSSATTYTHYQNLEAITTDGIVSITNGLGYNKTPLKTFLPNNLSSGGTYGATQYMKIGYINCDLAINQNKSNISILVSSCFYDTQHWSTHILTIGQASSIKGNKLKLGGNDRTFYYLKDTTNKRINIYAYCSGGNGYGDWCTQVIGKFGCDFVQEFAYNITYSSTWTEITAVS